MRISLVLFFVAVLLAAGCGHDPLGPGALVVVEIDVVPTGPVADSVTVSMVVESRSGAPIRIPYCFGLDLEVRDEDGALVWQRIQGYLLSICAPGYEELHRGETRRWSATWPLVDAAGQRVPPGTYRLTPVLRHLSLPDRDEVRGDPVSVVVL